MKCEQALALYSVGVLLTPFVFDLCFMQCKIFVSLPCVTIHGVHTSLRFVKILLTVQS
jgi:hypothetical protein